TNEGANIWISGIALDAYKRVEAKGTFTQAEFDALNSFTRTVIRLTAQSQDYMAVGYNTLKYLLPIMGISADERQFLMTVYIRQVNLCYADSSYSCQAEIAELGKLLGIEAPPGMGAYIYMNQLQERQGKPQNVAMSEQDRKYLEE